MDKVKVFDWDSAAQIIKVKGLRDAYAGLLGDWMQTYGCIMRDGEPVKDDMAYLASVWATPAIRFGDVTIPCFRYQEDVPEWDAHTLWPDSALEILKGGDEA